ncbi:MAG TPA: HNH endonuclease [Polyangiaceae bacterium]
MAHLLTNKGDRILVDDDLLPELAKHAWLLDGKGYPRRTIRVTRGRSGKKTAEYLHRRVIGAEKGQIVDHVNGNPLDARRANLRLVSPEQNSRNTHRSKNRKLGGFKGVFYIERVKRWSAQIGAGPKKPNGRAGLIHLGMFKTGEDAARAYDRAALLFFGAHAALNFEAERDTRLVEIDLLPWSDRLYPHLLGKRLLWELNAESGVA